MIPIHLIIFCYLVMGIQGGYWGLYFIYPNISMIPSINKNSTIRDILIRLMAWIFWLPTLILGLTVSLFSGRF